MTTQTATDRLRFRSPEPVKHGECGICGVDALCTSRNPFPKHDMPAHDVWAFETYGMHAVTFPARTHVRAWSLNPETMPDPGFGEGTSEALHRLRAEERKRRDKREQRKASTGSGIRGYH